MSATLCQAMAVYFRKNEEMFSNSIISKLDVDKITTILNETRRYD